MKWEKQIPIPVFDEHPEFNELYWKAWEIAHERIKHLPGMPQTPYMDEAFCDTDIWIWDSCFMSLFCKYAPEVFPGIDTLNNFYKVLYDKEKLPTIITKNVPEWIGETSDYEAPLKIHIADNPPLFAWAEYENALFSGDKGHVENLILNKQYLQKHYYWIEGLQEQHNLEQVRVETCLIKQEKGYLWEGGRSGMDNTPRGRIGKTATENRPNNPNMYWMDILAQQGLSALAISKLAKLIGQTELAEKWQNEFVKKKYLLNDLYWDEEDNFYYDIDCVDLDYIKVMTPAGYWPLTAQMASFEQARKISTHLNNPQKFGGQYPWVSLARDDADFNSQTGEYWRGSVWLPTAYAGLKGLRNYGLFATARESALKLLTQMYRTYEKYSPRTIWECYKPNAAEPACSCDESSRIVRKDFCGWSALGPISIYIEDIIGIHSINAFTNTVKWNLADNIKGKIGIKNLRFGNTVTEIMYENQICKVSSDNDFTLIVNGNKYDIKAGNNTFNFSNQKSSLNKFDSRKDVR